VSRQSAGAPVKVGSWAGVGVVQHQVHNWEGAGDEGDGEGAGSSGCAVLEEEWEQQAAWGRAARLRRRVLGDDREGAPEEAHTTNRLAPPSPRHLAVSCLGLPRGLGKARQPKSPA
jgi:hypothetical protein